MAKRKSKEDGFNTSVPDLITQFRESINLFLNHPAIPSPWPAWVPSPAHLDSKLNELEEAHRELHPDEVPGMPHRELGPDALTEIKRRDMIRRELKTDMSKLLRYVEQALTGSDDLLPPGFHLTRNPGCTSQCAAYGSGLATADSRSQRHSPETNSRWSYGEPLKKHLVRAVRPVFQAACIEVQASDPTEAIERALSSAALIPEELWRGKDETEDGFPFSFLDFSQYTVLSTDQEPFMVANGLEAWMREVEHPMSLANRFSDWINRLIDARDACYQKAIERCEEPLREWRGTAQKVVSLQPPADRRADIELVETTLACLRLLQEMD